MGLSVIIITLNEESNIARAIKSASFADQIIVVDSHSTDQTTAIAKQMGAEVFSEAFRGYGQQKNYAVSKCSHQWIFWLDADEEVDSQLAQSINKAIQSDDSNFYSLNRKTQFVDKWIQHGGWYPDHIIRLFKKSQGRFSEPQVHEKIVDLNDRQPSSKKLEGHLLHYSFPTIQSQILTNSKYAALGAKHLLEKMPHGPSMFSLYIKPIGKFLECFFWKRGFLDGIHGFIIAINSAHGMFQKYSIAYLKSKKSHD